MPPIAAFESQRKSLRNLVLSANKQAAYGGALADAALTRRQRFDGSAVLEPSTTRRSDKDQSGKGTEFATDGQITGFDSKFSFKSELDAWLAGFAFAFAMGKDVVTGAAGPYTHAITFDETSTIPPATTIYVEDTNDVKYKVPDMAVSDLTLTIPARGAIMAELGFVGTGRYTKGALGAPGLPAISAYDYLLGNDCKFSIGPSGAPVDITGRMMATTLKLSTQSEPHVAPGTGLYGVFVRRGLWKMSAQVTIAAKETDDIFSLFENDTLAEMKWVIDSGAQAKLTLDIPATKIKANKLGVDGNMVVWQLETDETTAFAPGGSQPLAVTVINGVAAYLVNPS